MKVFVESCVNADRLIDEVANLSTVPLELYKLDANELDFYKRGGEDLSRFYIPYLCEYKGWALYLPEEVEVLKDLAELELDDNIAVYGSLKNDKVLLFNCGHSYIKSHLKPKSMNSKKYEFLFTLRYMHPRFHGTLDDDLLRERGLLPELDVLMDEFQDYNENEEDVERLENEGG